MNLSLARPLAFFDLETTGINTATDRVVEIAVLKVMPDGSKESYTQRVNPTIPIPKEASEVHGIYDPDVAFMPTFAEIAVALNEFLTDCDLAGFNSNRFDIPLLVEEFLRTEVPFEVENRKFVDAQVIFHKMEERTLIAAYKFYCEKDLKDAHSAAADIEATYEVLEAQLGRYNNLETNVDFLHEFSQRGHKPVDFANRVALNDAGEEVFNFGKHKGKTVVSVFTKEPGYYAWIMDADFPRYTKQVFTGIWKRMREGV